jgi:hypothetical protein
MTRPTPGADPGPGASRSYRCRFRHGIWYIQVCSSGGPWWSEAIGGCGGAPEAGEAR